MSTDQNELTVRPGSELGDELHACIETIKEGEAVNVAAASEELPVAMFVAVKRVDGIVAGVGAIKRQRPWYARKIATESGFPFDEQLHELGYVAVRATHRNQGIARELLTHLLDAGKTRPLFATTASAAMKKLLIETGFQQRGHEWKKSTLSLWIKD
jgi:ribosomal protein S18 acetylase RimI-like enzyme